ncbi:unnamed protein product, partial [Staurois parvus]
LLFARRFGPRSVTTLLGPPSSSHLALPVPAYVPGGLLSHWWACSEVVTWPETVSSPSPPSGALVKAQPGLRPHALGRFVSWQPEAPPGGS